MVNTTIWAPEKRQSIDVSRVLYGYGSVSFTGFVDNYPKPDIRTELPPFVFETRKLDEQMHYPDPDYGYSTIARLTAYDARLSEGRPPAELPYVLLRVKEHEGRPISLAQDKPYGYSKIAEDVMRQIYSLIFVTLKFRPDEPERECYLEVPVSHSPSPRPENGSEWIRKYTIPWVGHSVYRVYSPTPIVEQFKRLQKERLEQFSRE